MRKVLYAIILVSLLFVPLERANVAKLLPIEAVAVYMEDEQIVLETDAGYKGTGNTALEALTALKKHTPKVVYLDTAEYLLVSGEATGEVQQLRPYLKSSVRVCVCEAGGRVKDAAEYLRVHAKLPKLRDWQP